MDADGIHATPDKIAAIERVRAAVEVFSRLVKLLPQVAMILKPLNDLLQKGRRWVCNQALKMAKELLLTSNLLTHYDATLSLRLATDAPLYGLGAVISHVLPNGEEIPVAFTSRSLSKSEQNSSQIDKEVLGLRKFHIHHGYGPQAPYEYSWTIE